MNHDFYSNGYVFVKVVFRKIVCITIKAIPIDLDKELFMKWTS